MSPISTTGCSFRLKIPIACTERQPVRGGLFPLECFHCNEEQLPGNFDRHFGWPEHKRRAQGRHLSLDYDFSGRSLVNRRTTAVGACLIGQPFKVHLASPPFLLSTGYS